MWTLIQSRLKQAAYIATDILTFTSGTGSNRLLLAFTSVWGGPLAAFVTGVSDPVNGAWSVVGARSGSGAATAGIFYKQGAAPLTSAQNVSFAIQGTSGVNGDHALVIAEFSTDRSDGTQDLDPSTAYNATYGNGATGAGGTSVTTGTVVTAHQGDLFAAVAGNDASSNVTWGTASLPWSGIQTSGTITFAAIASQYRAGSDPPGSYSQTFTQNVASAMAAKLAAFTDDYLSRLTHPPRIIGPLRKFGRRSSVT